MLPDGHGANRLDHRRRITVIESGDLLPVSAPPVNDTSLQRWAAAPQTHLPEIKPHACESSSKGCETVSKRRTADEVNLAPFGQKKAGHKQTAYRGKGWSHNLPLGWRQGNGNVVSFRYDATKLK